jgi:hypothetical protein
MDFINEGLLRKLEWIRNVIVFLERIKAETHGADSYDPAWIIHFMRSLHDAHETNACRLIISVSPCVWTREPLDGFSWNLILEKCTNNYRDVSIFVTTLHEDYINLFFVYRAEHLSERETFRTKAVETHFIPSTFSPWVLRL